MNVIIGSARHDENGMYANGMAGDQDGTEVSTQSFYKHSKGWYVLRAKSPAVAEKIASCMKWACDNQHIGYDQNQRDTLFEKAKLYDFDVRGVQTNVETDCSALVRVCCRYAGIYVVDFNTSNEVDVLENTGHFNTAFRYTDGDKLYTGDILCTCSKGHTVVVVSGESRTTYPIGWNKNANNGKWWYQYGPGKDDYYNNRVVRINDAYYAFGIDGYMKEENAIISINEKGEIIGVQ